MNRDGTRMSLENEDAQLHAAIEASLQDGSGKQAGEGSVVASRATAEVHASGHTHTKSIRLPAAKQARGKGKTEADKVTGCADAMTGSADAMTQPLLLAGEHVFVQALRAVPAEDWWRTWPSCRTIMLTRTSKKVKEQVQKMRLSAVVRLRGDGVHIDRLTDWMCGLL